MVLLAVCSTVCCCGPIVFLVGGVGWSQRRDVHLKKWIWCAKKKVAELMRSLQSIPSAPNPKKSKISPVAPTVTYLHRFWTLRTFPEAPSASTITSRSLIAFSSQTLGRLFGHLAESLRDDGNAISVWKVSDMLKRSLSGNDNKSRGTHCTFSLFPLIPFPSTRRTVWHWRTFFLLFFERHGTTLKPNSSSEVKVIIVASVLHQPAVTCSTS